MENDPKPYKFMKESIKKQPPDWKKIVLLIAGWLALAALGGLVADRSRMRQLPHLRRVRR